MDVWLLDTAHEVAERAADRVCDLLARNPKTRLGLATGQTPRELYRLLVERHREGQLSFRQAVTFNLDEYVGLGARDPKSFRHEMQEALFDHVDVVASSTHLPRGDAADPAEAADEYEALISAAGGIDLQILGIGQNGHLGFNEPTSSLASRTRVKTLAASTLLANGLSPEHEPVTAITMGIGTILDARALLLLATGASKADAVARAIEGPLTASCPASALQLHPNAVVLVDPEAAAGLALSEYYRRVENARQRASS